jgi:hypothetical protein
LWMASSTLSCQATARVSSRMSQPSGRRNRDRCTPGFHPRRHSHFVCVCRSCSDPPIPCGSWACPCFPCAQRRFDRGARCISAAPHTLAGRPRTVIRDEDAAIATGLVPCPFTTFILTYALARGKLAMGLAVVGGMLAGVILTICSFAVAAIFTRPSWCCRCWAVATRSSEVSSTIEPHRHLRRHGFYVFDK